MAVHVNLLRATFKVFCSTQSLSFLQAAQLEAETTAQERPQNCARLRICRVQRHFIARSGHGSVDAGRQNPR
jgi:hypothetical protein